MLDDDDDGGDGSWGGGGHYSCLTMLDIPAAKDVIHQRLLAVRYTK